MYVTFPLQTIWNLSDKSDEFCERIIKVGLHADILSYLGWETLSAAILNDPKSTAKRSFVQALVNILHNVVRRAEAARGAFRKCQAVNAVQKFRDVTEDPVIFYILCLFPFFYLSHCYSIAWGRL